MGVLGERGLCEGEGDSSLRGVLLGEGDLMALGVLEVTDKALCARPAGTSTGVLIFCDELVLAERLLAALFSVPPSSSPPVVSLAGTSGVTALQVDLWDLVDLADAFDVADKALAALSSFSPSSSLCLPSPSASAVSMTGTSSGLGVGHTAGGLLLQVDLCDLLDLADTLDCADMALAALSSGFSSS